MKFIVYNKVGKITRAGHCQPSVFNKQAGPEEFVIEGQANDVRQKIIDGKIVNKTPVEIQLDNPKSPKVPHERKRANITNKQLNNIMDRLKRLEDKDG